MAIHHHSWGNGDIDEYWDACQAMAKGGLPAVSFPSEYPPMAAVVFAGPRLLGANAVDSQRYYQVVFMVMALVAAVATVPSVAAIAPQVEISPSKSVWRYAFVLISLFQLVLQRYDIFPALCTILALRCLLNNRSAAAGAWLGMAIALKLYAVVLVPIFLFYALLRGRYRDFGMILSCMMAVNLLPLLPYFALHSTAFLEFMRYHRLRGLQVESLPGAFVLLAGKLNWTTAYTIDNYGADHVVSPLADILRQWQPVVAFSSLGLVTLHALWRMRADIRQTGEVAARTMVDESLIVLLTFIVTNKVLSPQYLVWIAPLLPLTSRRFFRAGLVLCIVTLVFYLKIYEKMYDGHLYAIVILNLRNAALAAFLLAIIFRSKKQNPAGASSDRVSV